MCIFFVRARKPGANPTTSEFTTTTTTKRCRLEHSYSKESFAFCAISCAVNYYNACIATCDRTIGSSLKNYPAASVAWASCPCGMVESGINVMIFLIFSPKNLAKILAFFAQTTASFCKNCDHIIGF
jgi:hypothetical protein